MKSEFKKVNLKTLNTIGRHVPNVLVFIMAEINLIIHTKEIKNYLIMLCFDIVKKN